MEGLVDLIGTGGLGGVFGAITGAFSKLANQYLEYRKTKAEYKHVYDMMVLQNEHDLLMAKQSLLEEEVKGSWDAFTETIKAETALGSGVSQEVADARAMFRMRFTIFLWAMVLMLVPASYFLPEALVINDLVIRVIEAILFTATAAGMMWFGAKAVTSRHQ